jgi:hypothetical protein
LPGSTVYRNPAFSAFRDILTAMFVPASRMPFDLGELIEQAIDQWTEIKVPGLLQPPAESYGDFIGAEVYARGLRQAIDQTDEALFDADASESQFRETVIAALDRWLIATEIRPRTQEEIDRYSRPCGE